MKRFNLKANERKALREYVEGLSEALPGRVQRVILFGSKARGEGRLSDTDIAVVVTGERTPSLRRTVVDPAYGPIVKFGVDLSPVVIPARLFRQASPFIRRIKREGIELWSPKRNTLAAA